MTATAGLSRCPYLVRYSRPVRLAKLIRDARVSAGLSQTALAARAKTSQPAIARYEAGVAAPSVATLERILRAARGSVTVGTLRVRATSRSPRGARFSTVRRSRAKLFDAARRHGISDVRVFGSVARGDEGADSDVDLLVDLAPERTLLDLIGFKQDADAILGRSVDAIAPRFLKPRLRARV